eukprot:Colp12_sorted_trinity150504_noHs@13165
MLHLAKRTMATLSGAGKRVVIVGGVAGGASAAARLRRNDESAHIHIYERGPHVSFANCGLPYYVGNVIKEQKSLLLVTPQFFKQRFNIDVHVDSHVVDVDPKAKTVTVVKGGEQTSVPYDELVLAPGANPIKPPFPGVDLPGIFTIRNVPDTENTKQWISSRPNAKSAVVVGGGFVGLEMAENLRHLGLGVTVIDIADQVVPPVDVEIAAAVANELKSHDIKLHLSDGVSSFAQDAEGRLIVNTSKGSTFTTDVVILSIGVKPDTTLAVKAGVELGKFGGIKVNTKMETNVPHIYAVGDAVEKFNSIIGMDMPFAMAGPANRQGRIVADNISGREAHFNGFIGSAVCGIFGLTVASTGASEKSLVRAGRKDFAVLHVHPNDHAGYYPGASRMHLKLIYSTTDGKILGAQATGNGGVDKRIDVIAMAIQKGGTVYDLEEAELCYAPQFGSAKDAVNIAGMAAANHLRGDVKVATWSEWANQGASSGAFLLDVREPNEVAGGKIDGSVNIPFSQLRERLSEVPMDKPVWVYCASGLRSYNVTRVLGNRGHDVRNISGGFTTYSLLNAK